jgi:hypothetical protein
MRSTCYWAWSAEGLEVGGALRLRLEAKGKTTDDRGQRGEEKLRIAESKVSGVRCQGRKTKKLKSEH